MTGISPIEVLNNINSEEGLARRATTAPDLLLSIRYGGILKDAVSTTVFPSPNNYNAFITWALNYLMPRKQPLLQSNIWSE